MATFCASCGSPLADGTRFCEKCGAAVTGPPPATAVPMASPVPAPGAPKGSNTAIKIIVAILAVIMLVVLMVAGSCLYFMHRVAQKAHEYTKEMGNVTPYAGKREPCAMLTADEASTAIGQAVSLAEPIGRTVCRYTFGTDSRQFNVQYEWQGGNLAMGIAHGVMKNMSSLGSFTPLEGVGDEAYLAPMGSTLMMRKGDVMVHMDLRVSGVSADAATKMARTIARRLSN
jgi:zinc-ribbon domain